MEEKMDALIGAVESLSEKSAVEYLLIVVPILISLIAIIISVRTAQKQNQIALFDKRYEALTWIQAMLAFSEGIKNCTDKLVVLYLFDGYFETSLCNKSEDDRFVEAMARVGRLKRDVMRVKFLFPSKRDTNLEEIVNLMQKYILAFIYDHDYLDSRDTFCQLCEEFYKSDFKRMAKKLKIKKNVG